MKIFCIGLGKTGTTSLAQALSILGYNSVHNPMSMVNYEDGVLNFDFDKVDAYDAFSDIQIALYYKDLDNRCSGSKFVLTTRDKKSWLASCKNHFNVYRKQLEKATAIHLEVYGTDSYDEKKLSDSYTRHINDVMKYFSERNQDLLILDVSEKSKWQKLCKFLDKPIPDCEYPTKNKSTPVPLVVKNFIRRLSIFRKIISVIKRKSYRIDKG